MSIYDVRNPPLMSCGCAANATVWKDGKPTCVVHGSTTVVEAPNLEGRQAVCCGEPRPSSMSLAFFVYRGPGSPDADKRCKHCGMYDFVHQEINPATNREGVTDHEFEPVGPWEFDSWYCGHSGWD